MDNVRSLKERIERLAKELQEATSTLDGIQRRCRHVWGEPKYNPIVTEAGSSPGDPEGTMGVDRQLPCSWPRTERPRWTRRCQICELEQHTERSEPVVTKNRPIF